MDPVKDGLNWYVYCGNNPLRYVDPDGLHAIEYDVDTIFRSQNDTETLLAGLGVVALAEPTPLGEVIWSVLAGVYFLGELLGLGGVQVVESSDFNEDAHPAPGITVTTDNLSLNGDPNSTVIQVDENGNPIKARHFGPDGKADYDIDYTDHGNPVNHPDVPHKHDWDWTNEDTPNREGGEPIPEDMEVPSTDSE